MLLGKAWRPAVSSRCLRTLLHLVRPSMLEIKLAPSKEIWRVHQAARRPLPRRRPPRRRPNMLSSTLLLLSYQLTAPPGAGLAPIRASAVRMSAAEDAAKAAWLAKQDAPAFGSRATFGPQRMSSAGEEAAKAAWLAKMDAPAWSKAAEAVASASASAAMTEAAEEACDQGVTAACDGLSREEEAKRAYAAQGSNPSLAD